MKRIYLWASAALLCCIGLSASAKGRVMRSPTCLLRTNAHASVTRVEFSDTATVAFLQVKGEAGARWHCALPIFAYDEECNRYALQNAQGLDGCMDTTGKLDIRLSFQPLPVKTRVFDIITEWPGSPFSFYGIGYDAKHKPSALHTFQDLSAAEKALEESLMQSGTVVVRGRIGGVDTMAVRPVAAFRYPCPLLYYEWEGVMVNEDGSFDCSAVMGHPTLTSGSLYAERGISFTKMMLMPGDTVTLDIPRLYVNPSYAISYSSGKCYDHLFLHNPESYLSGWLSGDKFLGEMNTPADVFVNSQSREAQLHDYCDYVTGKFPFTAEEAVLLRKCLDHFLLHSRVLALQRYCMQEHGHRPYDGLTDAQAQAAAKYLETALDDITLFLGPHSYELTLRSFGVPSFSDFHPDNLAGDYLRADSTYRDYFHFTHLPLMLQAVLLGDEVNIMGGFEPGQRVETATAGLREVVESSFLRDRIAGMADKIVRYNCETTQDISQRQGYAVLDSLTAMHRGKIVCLLTISDYKDDKTANLIDNLVADYRESADVALVFVADSTRMTQEFFDYIHHDLMGDYPCFYRLTPNEYNQLALLAGQMQGHFDGITLDREGKKVRNTLTLSWSSDGETLFRRGLRRLIKGQRIVPRYSLY